MYIYIHDKTVAVVATTSLVGPTNLDVINCVYYVSPVTHGFTWLTG